MNLLRNAMLLLCLLFLMSCASNTKQYIRDQTRTDMTQEHWPKLLNTNTSGWTSKADRWFHTGEPNQTEIDNNQAPPSAAITTTMVRVPDFTGIDSNGSYQLQIFQADHNSVYIYGPNSQTRFIAVDIVGNSMRIYQMNNQQYSLHKVIVRVGIKTLNSLTQRGAGPIEAPNINSDSLNLTATGRGSLLLAGNVNLKSVTTFGCGTLTVLGANTPALDINMNGCTDINLMGRMGVRWISHTGTGNLNLIGVKSDNLSILSSGAGTITVNGTANVRKLQARGATRVYLNQVNSDHLYVCTEEQARVGLAGFARELIVETNDRSMFEGQYLNSDISYVSAQQYSHANVTGDVRIFADSMDNSSIYYFGNREALSKFTSQNGSVILIPTAPRPAMVYKLTRVSAPMVREKRYILRH